MRHYSTLIIIGSGFGGLALAVRLKRLGFERFIIVERSDQVGGVWRDHVYPGVACDVPAATYYLEDQGPMPAADIFATGSEIQNYLESTVSESGLQAHLRFDTDVEECRYLADTRQWKLTTSNGTWYCRYLISAIGTFGIRQDLPFATENYRGQIWHTGQWPTAEPSLRGKTIGVIGTGASAIQVIPELAKICGKLEVFQRSPAHVLPRMTGAPEAKISRSMAWLTTLVGTNKFLLNRISELYGRGLRHPSYLWPLAIVARRLLHKSVKKPAIRQLLQPPFRLGCKRLLLSNSYLEVFSRDHVTLHSDLIKELTANGVRTANGAVVALDSIVLATGYDVAGWHQFDNVYGLGDLRLGPTLRRACQTFFGTAVRGFPNFFMLQGPNTLLAHGSVVKMMEHQVDHLTKLILSMEEVLEDKRPTLADDHNSDASYKAAETRDEKLPILHVRSQAVQNFVALVGRLGRGTPWNRGQCNNWFIDRHGRNTTLWPGSVSGFGKRLAEAGSGAYEKHYLNHSKKEGGLFVKRSRIELASFITPVAALAEGVLRLRNQSSAQKNSGLRPDEEQLQSIVGRPEVRGDYSTSERLDPSLATLGQLFHGVQHLRITDSSVHKARRRLRHQTRLFGAYKTPLDIEVQTLTIASQLTSIAARTYYARPFLQGAGSNERLAKFDQEAPKRGLTMYFHGGGLALGDLDTHDSLCRALAAEGSNLILAIDYPKSPEHSFEQICAAAWHSYRWVLEHSEQLQVDTTKISLAGDSAGALLVAHVANVATSIAGNTASKEVTSTWTRAAINTGTNSRVHTVTSNPAPGDQQLQDQTATTDQFVRAPVAQLLIYPVIHFDSQTPSRVEYANGPFLQAVDIERFRSYLEPELGDQEEDGLWSNFAKQVRGRTLIITAGHDPLRDEGRQFATDLDRAGQLVKHYQAGNMPHGFIHFAGISTAARLHMERIFKCWRTFLETPDV